MFLTDLETGCLLREYWDYLFGGKGTRISYEWMFELDCRLIYIYV